MTPELQRYYEDRFSMISSDGWKDLVFELNERLDLIDKCSDVDDEKTLFYRKGTIHILNWLINLKEITEFGYNEAKENEDIA